jgi:hypothetical protein
VYLDSLSPSLVLPVPRSIWIDEISVTCSMSFSMHTIASSPTFQDVFNAALVEHANKTGEELARHPLAAELEKCKSAEAVLFVFREQTKAFREFREGNKRLMKILEPTVNVLCSLSLAFGDSMGLVRPL